METLAQILARNAPVTAQDGSNAALAGRVPSVDFNTRLDPGQEQFFRQWVGHNNVPFNPDATVPQDYDMRGFYQGLQQQNPKAISAVDPNDGRMHYPDFWKTPAHETFSNESQWAAPNAPGWNANDQLIGQGGRVMFDDRSQISPLAKILSGERK